MRPYNTEAINAKETKRLLATEMLKKKQQTEAKVWRYNGFREIFLNYGEERLNRIMEIWLPDHYEEGPQARMILCLICRIYVTKAKVFDHTVGAEHQKNKQFYKFVQNHRKQGNMNYLYVDKLWVQCRYCDNVRFDRHAVNLQKQHAANAKHQNAKLYCISRVASECVKPSNADLQLNCNSGGSFRCSNNDEFSISTNKAMTTRSTAPPLRSITPSLRSTSQPLRSIVQPRSASQGQEFVARHNYASHHSSTTNIPRNMIAVNYDNMFDRQEYRTRMDRVNGRTSNANSDAGLCIIL